MASEHIVCCCPYFIYGRAAFHCPVHGHVIPSSAPTQPPRSERSWYTQQEIERLVAERCAPLVAEVERLREYWGDTLGLVMEVQRLRMALRDIQNVAEDFLVDAAHARARLDYIGAQARRALGGEAP